MNHLSTNFPQLDDGSDAQIPPGLWEHFVKTHVIREDFPYKDALLA